MKKSYKSSNFLDTLDKYTKRKRKDTIEDMKKQEEAELKKAEEEITKDVNAMINKKLIAMKNKVFIEVSKKEIEERKKFFRKRKEIMEDMFTDCKKKLIEFTKKSDYENSLKHFASRISEVLNKDDTILFVKEDDFKHEDLIRKAFGKKCEIVKAKDIEIGGIRGYSREQGIMVDETLDTKLYEQEDWAIENFGILLV